MRVLSDATRYTKPEGKDTHWVEHLRTADLSVGTYCIVAGGIDDQEPHTEDEVYVVATGRGILESGGVSTEVGPGSVVFVPAGEPHRFTEASEDLAVLVIFGPAEYSRASDAPPPVDHPS